MQQQERQALAAEVVEMGEQLFSLALEAHSDQHRSADEETGAEQPEQAAQADPLAELAAASSDFFTALRFLLDIQQG